MRRTAAGVLAGALALSGAVAAGTPAYAAPTFGLERIAGDDRYETSAETVEAFGAAPGAILAAGENGRQADALAASFLAGVRGVPVALTTKTRVTDEVLAALNGLGGKNITIIGGEDAVSASVVTQLRNAGFTVDRIGGVNRYATAAAVVAAGEGASASNVGLLASGTSTIDALAGGPVAYKGKHPLFLTTQTDIPGVIVQAMKDAGITSVYVLGGEAVVAPSVLAELAANGITVAGRLAGADRSATSVAIARAVIGGSFGFSADTFNVASGLNNGVDALGGAALSGKQNRVLLITNTATSAAPIVAFADENDARLTAVGNVFGGPAVVNETLVNNIEDAGGDAGQFETLNVVPNDTQRLTLVPETGTPPVETGTATEQNADNRTYTVAGLNNALRYRVTLVNGTSVQGTGASRTFLSSAVGTTPETFAVDTGADIADIVAVGGINAEIGNTGGTNTLNTATVSPVNGSITFTIDGKAAGTVVPVVYVDGGQGGTATTGGASNRLETSATAAGGFAAATETFGVGGATVYVQPAAPVGTITSAVIATVDKDADQFASNQFTFTFDANDVFEVDGVRVTQAVFEANLSGGDTITGNIATDPSLPSTFQLDDNDPAQAATPTVVPGTGANSNDVTVTVTVAAGVDAVQFQRAPVTNGTAGTFTTIATEPATDDVATTDGIQVVFNDNDLAAGTYAYRVVLVNDGDTGAASTAVNATTTSPAAADTTAPTVLDTRVGTNTGSAFLLDAGDSFLLALSEAVAAPAAGDTFRVSDADGTLIDIVAAGGNVSLNSGSVTINGTTYAAGRVLTVTRGTDVVVVAGTQTGLGLPATITQQAGTTDAAGNQLNIAGSADVVIDTEAGTVTTPDPTTPAAQNLNSAVAASGTNDLTVTYENPVNCASVAVGDFAFALTGGGAITPTTVACTGTNDDTLVFTFPGSAFTNETGTVNVTADAVNDESNAPQPADSVGFTTA